jgi:hypothetical protein
MNPDADPELDQLLRRHFDTALPDAGFTARVVAALPPRPRPRNWALPLAAGSGAALTWVSVSPSPLWRHTADAWVAGSVSTPLLVACGLFLTCTLLACSWALVDND